MRKIQDDFKEELKDIKLIIKEIENAKNISNIDLLINDIMNKIDTIKYIISDYFDTI